MFEIELKKLGFSDKEAKVYATLHKIGPAVASTLARLTGIKRTSIYDILNALMERDLVITFKQGKYIYYAIDDLEKLFLQEKHRLSLAETLVKKMKESPQNWEGLQVNYYKGVEGYREMYEDILRYRPKELCGWMHLDKFYEGIDMGREDQWTKERIKYGIKVRLLLQDTALAREFSKDDSKSNRQTRFIEKNPFDVTCFAYDGHVAFFDSSAEPTGIRIHHPGFYELQQAVFDMTWKFHRE